MAKKAPFESMIGISIRDHDGREVASVGSVEDDLDGRVAFEIHRRMSMGAPLLAHVVQQLWTRHSATTEKILHFLGDRSIFQSDRHTFVAKGVDAFARSEHHIALCVLIPEIEAGLRRLLHLLGGSIYKRARSGGTNLRNLEEILRDPVVVSALSEKVCFYLRVLLTDPRGWNLRNTVCHGLLRANDINRSLTDRIFHVLVLLGCVRLSEVPTQNETPAEEGA